MVVEKLCVWNDYPCLEAFIKKLGQWVCRKHQNRNNVLNFGVHFLHCCNNLRYLPEIVLCPMILGVAGNNDINSSKNNEDSFYI